jgi:hypothetical protein
MSPGHLHELIGLGRPDAAHLQPDRPLGPVPEQRFDDFENDRRRRQHRDHDVNRGDELGQLIHPPGATLLESSDLLRVAVPGDYLDAPIEEAMSHGGSHQADPEQTYANLLLVSIGVHSVSSIISQAGPIGQAIRGPSPTCGGA